LAALLLETLKDLVANKIVTHDVDALILSGVGVSWEYLAGWEQQCELRCDVVNGLKQLLDTAQVDRADILCLDMFLCGYKLVEMPVTNAGERLVRTLALLEHTIGYGDEKFLDRVLARFPKLVAMKDAYRVKLLEAGRVFEEIPV